MSRFKDNFCVGCPQGCINCGRKHDVLVIECDRCGELIYDIDDVVENEYGYDDLCKDCHKSLEKQEDDGFFNRCDGCDLLRDTGDDFVCMKHNKSIMDIYECGVRTL